MLSLIFRYEWRRFRRNRLQVALVVVLALFGLYAIYYLPAFHRQIVDFYYPRLFGNRPLTAADYPQRPVFRLPPLTRQGVGLELLQLLVVAAGLFGLGYLNLPRQLRR